MKAIEGLVIPSLQAAANGIAPGLAAAVDRKLGPPLIKAAAGGEQEDNGQPATSASVPKRFSGHTLFQGAG